MARQVFISVMGGQECGSVSSSVARVALVPDRRYKHCSKDASLHGGVGLKAAFRVRRRRVLHACS